MLEKTATTTKRTTDALPSVNCQELFTGELASKWLKFDNLNYDIWALDVGNKQLALAYIKILKKHMPCTIKMGTIENNIVLNCSIEELQELASSFSCHFTLKPPYTLVVDNTALLRAQSRFAITSKNLNLIDIFSEHTDTHWYIATHFLEHSEKRVWVFLKNSYVFKTTNYLNRIYRSILALSVPGLEVFIIEKTLTIVGIPGKLFELANTSGASAFMEPYKICTTVVAAKIIDSLLFLSSPVTSISGNKRGRNHSSLAPAPAPISPLPTSSPNPSPVPTLPALSSSSSPAADASLDTDTTSRTILDRYPEEASDSAEDLAFPLASSAQRRRISELTDELILPTDELRSAVANPTHLTALPLIRYISNNTNRSATPYSDTDDAHSLYIDITTDSPINPLLITTTRPDSRLSTTSFLAPLATECSTIPPTSATTPIGWPTSSASSPHISASARAAIAALAARNSASNISSRTDISTSRRLATSPLLTTMPTHMLSRSTDIGTSLFK